MAFPKPVFEIEYYHDYISPELATYLLSQAKPVDSIQGLTGIGASSGLETKESLQFLVDLYKETKDHLKKILIQRIADRKFIDERVKACCLFNERLNRDILDSDYKTIIGLEDAKGRIVIGPLNENYFRASGAPIAPIPEFLKGSHVTLFGPPDSAKMAINAMNAYHRVLKDEPAIVGELLSKSDDFPKWGADDEDSKTPLRTDLVDAGVNLTSCFEGTIRLIEGTKKYELAKDKLSLPIKRFPGLALPSTFLFFENNPIPLHLYDFALHFFNNCKNPKALVFYVPKLENEEEARYIKQMIKAAEKLIKGKHPDYQEGTVRLMIVLENPRAILRTNEIMDELYPYFVGASLGWHDYLASTARIFKEDRNYRIPVKADPDIVIKYIKASHLLLSDVVGERGAIKVGGMYGILPLDNNLFSPSFQTTIKGFIKDVLIQLKRNLTGFWVAHPDFVRLGLAFVEAWKHHLKGHSQSLKKLISGLLIEPHRQEVLQYLERSDIKGMDVSDPNYVRTLIVADIKESDFISNNHPEEIRYNVFQSLQYLTDWLSGNGCVALPAIVNGVAVRVMDDLATAERSRWEVWHEIYHGRFSIEEFLKIVHEEMLFIRKDDSNDKKIVQVKWNDQTKKWYPVAMHIMIKLMTDKNPVEFATELLMPFTVEAIRNSEEPLRAIQEIESKKYQIQRDIEKFNYYFEACGCVRLAKEMARKSILDISEAEDLVLSFSLDELKAASLFHGNIGENKGTLDTKASSEQKLVLSGDDAIRSDLRGLGEVYLKKFGIKFLTSAKGRTGQEILSELKDRLSNSQTVEIDNARKALWEITRKRLLDRPLDHAIKAIDDLRRKYEVAGVSVAINNFGRFGHNTQILSFGEAIKGRVKVTPQTKFELASLSKTIGAAFAMEYFKRNNIPLTTPVNSLLAKANSDFRLACPSNPKWAEEVQIIHLMNHSALNMHYVKGIRFGSKMPNVSELIKGHSGFGYEQVIVANQPGQRFQYSGGGFLVLEHLIEILEQKPIQQVTKEFLNSMGLISLSFDQNVTDNCAEGYFDDGHVVPGGRLMFPAFAAGALGTAKDMALFLNQLTIAYEDVEAYPISHDTAVEMLRGRDLGCREFMNCQMGIGIFVAEAGRNKIALHQGANEGFRSLFLQVYDGPDRGRGLVIFANGDNRSVLLISEIAQLLLKEMRIEGIDYQKFESNFDFSNLSQEQIVNMGYKKLLFDAFVPDLPEEIAKVGPRDSLANFNLAVGAKILEVTDQKFARAANLISPFEPQFDPELFGSQGKIMDSWETVRHNESTCDYLILELNKPSVINYVCLSTKYHDGNHPEYVRLLATRENNHDWHEILAKTKLNGHSILKIKRESDTHRYSRVKVEIYPDGGLSRLGLFERLPDRQASDFEFPSRATSKRFDETIPKTLKPLAIPYVPDKGEVELNYQRSSDESRIDFASLAFGGNLIGATNEHYGPAKQVISPFPPINMFDGLESARSRKPDNFEEVIIQLGRKVRIDKIQMDFKYFVNNNPLFVSVEALKDKDWLEVVPKTKCKAFAGNMKEFSVSNENKFEKIRVRTYPDGGINRVKVFGSTH